MVTALNARLAVPSVASRVQQLAGYPPPAKTAASPDPEPRPRSSPDTPADSDTSLQSKAGDRPTSRVPPWSSGTPPSNQSTEIAPSANPLKDSAGSIPYTSPAERAALAAGCPTSHSHPHPLAEPGQGT